MELLQRLLLVAVIATAIRSVTAAETASSVAEDDAVMDADDTEDEEKQMDDDHEKRSGTEFKDSDRKSRKARTLQTKSLIIGF